MGPAARVSTVIAAARDAGRRALDEHAAKQVLAAYGIAVPKAIVVPAEDGGDHALAVLAPPLVAKAMSRDVLHKSEVGGVTLNIRTPEQLKAALDNIRGAAATHAYRLDGFLIEEMVLEGRECVIGLTNDSRFGPIIMFGLGGVFVEVIEDVTFRICPITEIDAREMIHELRSARLLAGFRGYAPVSSEAIVDVLLRVGGENGLAGDVADAVEEIDVNPLIVSTTGAVAADARFILKRGPEA